jgi:hypothetical protein
VSCRPQSRRRRVEAGPPFQVLIMSEQLRLGREAIEKGAELHMIFVSVNAVAAGRRTRRGPKPRKPPKRDGGAGTLPTTRVSRLALTTGWLPALLTSEVEQRIFVYKP